MLRLDRLRALVDVYPGVEREDEMVAAFDFCLHGKGGAAPSIDTAMHGLVDAPHVDHLHPDSGIALATAADGEKLTADCFGDRVVWVPWRRPGFQLGLDIAAVKEENPQAIGVILGGHGITAWGETSEEAQANSLEIIPTAQEYLDRHGVAEPFGPVVPGYEPLPEAERRAIAAAIFPTIRGLGLHRPPAGRPLHRQRRRAGVRLARGASAVWPRWARPAPTTSCAPRSRRWSWTCPAARPDEETSPGAELHAAYRADYAAYYQRHATPDSPAMRGADPAIVLVPGVGMFSFGDKQTARVAGEFYVNAINVMRGAESVSTLRADPRVGEVPHRVLGSEGGQARPHAEAQAPRHPGRAGHRGRVGHRDGDRQPAGRRGRLRGGRRPEDLGAARSRRRAGRGARPGTGRSGWAPT